MLLRQLHKASIVHGGVYSVYPAALMMLVDLLNSILGRLAAPVNALARILMPQYHHFRHEAS